MKEHTLSEEQKRLADLQSLEILDTPHEEAFNEIVELASEICETPISLISLIDENRQWFKAKTGMELSETSRTVSFCAHAIHKNNLFVVQDATKDNRFADNELVTGNPNIRFYAGAPFSSPNGYPVGTLCVIDNKPKELTWKQASALKTLANQVAKLIELHYKNKKIAELTAELDIQLKKTEKFETDRQRENVLCQIQLSNFSKFLLGELELLKTGKFTKKDLSEIYSKAENYELQIRNFKEGFGILNKIRSNLNNTPAQTFSISSLVEQIGAELEPLCKTTTNKLIPYIPKELEIRQNEAILRLILKSLLYYILSNVYKTDINIVSTKRENGIEIRITLINKSLQGDLNKYITGDSITENAEDLKFIELSLVKEILTEIKGSLEINKLGDAGTIIMIFIPVINNESPDNEIHN